MQGFVGGVGTWLASVATRLSVACLRRSLHRLDDRRRREYCAAAVERGFHWDFDTSLATVDGILSARHLTEAQRALLLSRACTGFVDGAMPMPLRERLLSLACAGFADGAMPMALRERLLSLACAGFADGAMPMALRERLLSMACRGGDPASMPTPLLDHVQSLFGGVIHYSQEGEDLIVDRLFGDRRDGFYVDIGAHHATRFSNTFALYRRGWRGVNVDATPGSMASFKALRPQDVNLESIVSDRAESLRMHLFREPALNTADAALAASYVAGGWEKIGEVELSPRTLVSILDEHVPSGTSVTLLSVDVEGEDLAVLRSGDWNRYRPEVVIIEVLDTAFEDLEGHPAVRFLTERGYRLRSRLFNSVLLLRAEG